MRAHSFVNGVCVGCAMRAEWPGARTACPSFLAVAGRAQKAMKEREMRKRWNHAREIGRKARLALDPQAAAARKEAQRLRDQRRRSVPCV